VLLKPDGTLLVHTAEQRTPVNWQPPGCEHGAAVEVGRLRITSVRSSPAETIDVGFEEVYAASAFEMEDPRDLELTGTEEDLRDRVIDDPDLLEEGFDPVESEYRTPFGAVDLLGRDRDGRPVVVELKRRRVGPEAVSQLVRYVDAVRVAFDRPAYSVNVLTAGSSRKSKNPLIGSTNQDRYVSSRSAISRLNIAGALRGLVYLQCRTSQIRFEYATGSHRLGRIKTR
jgi:hypothetical protein